VRLPAHYSVRFTTWDAKYTRNFWVKFTEDGWEPVDAFCLGCLVDKQKAEAFLRLPGLDSRYSIWKVELNALKEG